MHILPFALGTVIGGAIVYMLKKDKKTDKNKE